MSNGKLLSEEHLKILRVGMHRTPSATRSIDVIEVFGHIDALTEALQKSRASIDSWEDCIRKGDSQIEGLQEENYRLVAALEEGGDREAKLLEQLRKCLGSAVAHLDWAVIDTRTALHCIEKAEDKE